MAYDPKLHVIHSANGLLADPDSSVGTRPKDVTDIVAAALAADKPELVIHFHGGLVNSDAGYGIAKRLWPTYASPTRYGLFFVWEAGLVESISNNLDDILKDKLFRQLVKKATRWVIRELPPGVGIKGAGGPVDEAKLEDEFDDYFDGKRADPPDALTAPTSDLPKVKSAFKIEDESELALKIQLELEADQEFADELRRIDEDITPESVGEPRRKLSGVGAIVTTRSEISPEKVPEIFNVDRSSKGVLTLLKSSLLIAKIVLAVVRRFRDGHAHGMYTTIVEEVLAAAYVDKIGGVVWGQMKKDTADAFGSSPRCAGTAVLRAISAIQSARGKKFERIILIGHSTGAIYIANWLEASATILPDAKYDVLLLAPAVTYDHLADALEKYGKSVENIRRFAMRDEIESRDVLVPIIYRRSLLYFVSGLLEFSKTDPIQRVPDTPLVGMERYGLNASSYKNRKSIELVEDRLRASKGSIWSRTESDAADGERCEAIKHGDFDNEAKTVASLLHITSTPF